MRIRWSHRFRPPRLLVGWLVILLLAFAGSCTPPSAQAARDLAEAQSCRACHQAVVDSFVATAHSATSAPAGGASIRGPFEDGRNILRTALPHVWFRMEARGGTYTQTAVDERRSAERTERFDIVVGSGRKGQSYLYWRDRRLYQLPVSYLTAGDEWINSPGYQDGVIDFGRVIVPRCLECHATSFVVETPPGGISHYTEEYRLGISCAKCHGDGREHVARQTAGTAQPGATSIVHPGRLSQERQLDACALCHGGLRPQKQPAFSFRPGDRLEDFFGPRAEGLDKRPDVHGDQVGLLRRSQCFQASPGMTCSTCHDVHRTECDLRRMADKCLACHQVTAHAPVPDADPRDGCVRCHMPNRMSRALQINRPGVQDSIGYRSHLIGIYPPGRLI
jgi:hypothetical protein